MIYGKEFLHVVLVLELETTHKDVMLSRWIQGSG
jgi:hypothetical protein